MTVAGRAGENTVIWVPNDSDDNKKDNHLYTVPAGDEWRWLGSPGQVLWTAPQDVSVDQLPIYLGYGRINDDYDFEDYNYALDLVEVDGPGDVEVFTETFDGPRRVYSSTDPRYRSYIQPRHSHMYTTFTKPGRYVLTYRTAARDAETKDAVPAKEVKVAYQVGGEWPEAPYKDQMRISDMREAFHEAAARAGASEAASESGSGPKLTLQPHAETTPGGDATGTDITFTTGNSADDGSLFLTLNGYHFLEYPVHEGKAATWDFLGDGAANFQAVYIPKDGTPTAAWASEKFSYDRTTAGITEVTATSASLADETPGPHRVPGWTPEDLNFSDTSVDVVAEPLEAAHKYRITVTPKSPGLLATVRLRFAEDKKDPAPSCSEEFFLNGEAATVDKDLGGCEDGYFGVDVTPHPYSNLPVVKTDYEKVDLAANGLNKSVELAPADYAALGNEGVPSLKDVGEEQPAPEPEQDPDEKPAPAPDTEADNPTEEPSGTPTATATPTASPSTQPKEPETSGDTKPTATMTPTTRPSASDTAKPGEGEGANESQDTGKRPDGTQPIQSELGLIKSGHVDIRLTPTKFGNHLISVAHETNTSKSGDPVLHQARSVALEVPARAAKVRGDSLADPAYDVLGPVGGTFYELPAAQQSGLVWPGFSTENLDYANYDDDVTYAFTLPVKPEGGRLAFSNQANKGGKLSLEPIIDSADPAKMVLPTTQRTHMHGAWTFTKPGLYGLCIGATSKGKTLATLEPLRFIVGEDNAVQVLKDSESQPIDCSAAPMPEGSGQDGKEPEQPGVLDKIVDTITGRDDTAAPDQKDPKVPDSPATPGAEDTAGKPGDSGKGKPEDSEKAEAKTGSITGRVFLDKDRNGVLNQGEGDISDVKVSLKYGQGAKHGKPGEPVKDKEGKPRTATTHSPYTFDALPYDDYVVEIDEKNQAPLKGAKRTTQKGSGGIAVKLDQPVSSGNDFGYYIASAGNGTGHSASGAPIAPGTGKSPTTDAKKSASAASSTAKTAGGKTATSKAAASQASASKSSTSKSSEAKAASGGSGSGKGGSAGSSGNTGKGGPLAKTGEDAATMGWLITGAIAAAGGAMLVLGIRRSQKNGG